MYEVREKQDEQWVRSEFVGENYQKFFSIKETIAEVEVYLAGLEISYEDGYLLEFNDALEREKLAIFNVETGRFYNTIKKLTRV